jgi:ribonuclease VapC
LIVDSSAVVALLRGEPRQLDISARLFEAEMIAIGAPTLLETTMVMTRISPDNGESMVSAFVAQLSVEVIPFEQKHWQVAAEAFVRFGKGKHPAALNFGDCMTYATARVAELPLLFIGDDFAQTDIEPA